MKKDAKDLISTLLGILALLGTVGGVLSVGNPELGVTFWTLSALCL